MRRIEFSAGLVFWSVLAILLGALFFVTEPGFAMDYTTPVIIPATLFNNLDCANTFIMQTFNLSQDCVNPVFSFLYERSATRAPHFHSVVADGTVNHTSASVTVATGSGPARINTTFSSSFTLPASAVYGKYNVSVKMDVYDSCQGQPFMYWTNVHTYSGGWLCYNNGITEECPATTYEQDLIIYCEVVPVDTTPPVLSACYPANGSTVSEGSIQFRINATDETALAALNHTDSFTGTTIYNFTPYNATPWFVTVPDVTNGTYWWMAEANDTAGNSAGTGNCSLIVIIPETTTTSTTIPANSTIRVVVDVASVPGLRWLILLLIILVLFILFGGLAR